MTKAELKAIKARADKATPGAWREFHYPEISYGHRVEGGGRCVSESNTRDREQDCFDGKFIAHAREDIPALLAWVGQLQEQIRRMMNLTEEDIEKMSQDSGLTLGEIE